MALLNELMMPVRFANGTVTGTMQSTTYDIHVGLRSILIDESVCYLL